MMSDEQIPASSGTQILDATQKSLIEAVDNLSEIIAETSEFEVHHKTDEPFYLSAEFWVGAAFVLVVVGLGRPIFKALKGLLEKRVVQISDRIDDARRLRDEAQELLAEYERKYVGSFEQAEALVAEAKREIDALCAYEFEQLNKKLEIEKRQTEREIAAEIEKTRAELEAFAVAQALEIVAAHLSAMSEKAQAKLIDESIKNIFSKENAAKYFG